MVKNPKFLKNLLTTASAMAIGFGAANAMAATKTTNNVAATGQNGVGGLVGFDNADFTAGADDIAYGADNTTITTTGAWDLSAKVIANGKNGSAFVVGHAVTYGAGLDLTNITLTVNAGSITLQDLTGVFDATVNGGTLIMRDAGHDLIVSGGIATVNDVAQDVTQTGGTINQAGTIAGTLNVSGAGSVFAGAAAATDVGVNVILGNNLGNGTVTIRDAAGDVTVVSGTLDLRNQTNKAKTITQTGGTINQAGTIAGTLNVSGAGSVFAGAAAATDVDGTVTLGNNLGAGTVTIQDATGDVTVAGGTLNMRNSGGLSAANVTGGALVATGNLGGALNNTVGTVTVGGNVAGASTLNGAGTTKITGNAAAVTVQADHTTEIGGNVGATNFASDETITLKGDESHTVGAVTAANVGTFIADEALANKTLEFTGLVGLVGNSLKLIQVKGGTTVKLDNVSYIKNIDFGTQDSVLQLSGADYKIEGVSHANNSLTLIVDNGAARLLAGSVISTADNRLKAVNFNGGKTLTLADGVSIYAINSGSAAGTGITTTGDGKGRLVFEGDSTVDAVFTRSIGRITSANAIKTVTFTNDVKVSTALRDTGIITIGNGGTMQFNGGIAAQALQGAGVNQGTAVFNNTSDTTITLAGAGTGLLAVKITGGNLNFATALPVAQTYAFGTQATAITATGDEDLTRVTLTTDSTTRNQNFKLVNGDLDVGAVGTSDKHFGTFSVDSGKIITVNNANFFASLGGAGAKASFEAANGVVDNIGAANAAMDTVTFKEDITVAGNSYAKILTVEAGKKGTFGGIVDGGVVTLDKGGAPGVATTATFNDGSTLVSKLSGTVGAKAIVNFAGGSTIKNGIGKSGLFLAELNFTDTSGAKTQSLAGDIYAVKSTFGKTLAQATSATTFHGQVVAQDTNIDLGTAGIKLADGTAATPSTVKGAINVYTTFNGSTNGQLTLDGANTKVDMSGVTSLNVTLNDTTQGRVRTTSTIQILDTTNPNFVGLAAVTANATGQGAGNNNVQWTFDNSKLQFTSNDVSDKVVASVVAANGGTAEAKQNIVAIFDAVDGTDAASLAREWSTLSNIAPAAEAEAVNRLSSTTANVATTAVTTALAQTVSSTTTARMQTLANPAALRVTQADGVSAGAEDTLRYGVWGSPFYSQGVQKMRKGVSGYKAKTVGGTVGFDTMANDTMIVGVAATVAKTDLKHKDINAGDKTKADTLMFSIYGLQEINNDWFLQGVATFGSTKIKNTSKRIDAPNGAVNVTTATGKYDSMTWGGELLAGYNFNVSSMAVLTPMLGFDYARTNDGGFTETGTRNQNLTISKKSTDKTQVVAGIRAVMADIEQSGFVITPEVHGFVRQALGNKQPKISVQLDGAGQLATNNTKPAKTNGNLGLGINASSGMMTYGLTYDANLANKYVGHQGTFKVRVNF